MFFLKLWYIKQAISRGCCSSVECELPKLERRVRLPSPAPSSQLCFLSGRCIFNTSPCLMADCSSPKKFYNFLGCFFLRSLSFPFCLPTFSRSLSSKRFCDYTFIGLGKESGADLGGCRTKQTRSVLAVRDCPLSAYAEQRRCRYTCPKEFCFSVLYNRLQNRRFCVIMSSNMPQRRQNSGGFFMGDDPLP